MKIYTRTGDNGSTGLFAGPRVAKDHQRIEAYGTVDELNATLGCVRTSIDGTLHDELDEQIHRIQSDLFSIGAELSTPDPSSRSLRIIGEDHIKRLENWIDEHESKLPELKQFILPAGCHAATFLQLARAVCRRAERRCVTLNGIESDISDHIVVYLNRLSDYLFVVSRTANMLAGVSDVPWTGPEYFPWTGSE